MASVIPMDFDFSKINQAAAAVKPVVTTTPAITGTAGLMDKISGLGGNIMSGAKDLLMGKSGNEQMMAYKGKNGARSFARPSQMGGMKGTLLSDVDRQSLTGADYDNIRTANAAYNVGGSEKGGLLGKILSPEGAVAGLQLYAGIKQMRREDEKFEIMKRDKEESDKRAKERRAGRLALGDTLGTIGR